MKHKTKLIVLAVSITALFSSCIFLIPSTHKFNLDQQNPVDQNVIINFDNDTKDGYFILKEWNGININDTIYKKMIKSNDNITITVPAGNNSFLFDLKNTFSSQSSSITYTSNNIELKYFFEAGKKYEIKGEYKLLGLGFKGVEIYVQLYDVTKKTTLLKEWMVGKK
jgi:hypothetical protein